MTQEVQPLTWQKRTNLEEHQQFFSKINEIIANLAPTVDKAEAAIAQATQAIASANSAIANANSAIANANDAVKTADAASAAASAAASQAQTAASTVAGYDTRLTTAEGDIDDLKTADAQNVKISRINEYAVGLTGNQNISGIKKFIGDNVKIQGGLTFNDADSNNDLLRGSIFNTTPHMFIRSYSQIKNNEYAEMRIGCDRTDTSVTFGVYLLSYINENGVATLKDYHPIYEKVVTI